MGWCDGLCESDGGRDLDIAGVSGIPQGDAGGCTAVAGGSYVTIPQAQDFAALYV